LPSRDRRQLRVRSSLVLGSSAVKSGGRYVIEHGIDGEELSRHQTRQGATDAWRLRFTGLPVKIWREYHDAAGRRRLVVEGIWHQAKAGE
jgi:hypothetical protein